MGALSQDYGIFTSCK